MTAIREMTVTDVDGMLAHVGRLWAEREQVRSRPYAHGTPLDRGAREERLRTLWPRSVGEPGWMRTWGLCADDGAIVGHVDLKGGQLASELHRATLGIALEPAYRDRGHGRALCETAIGWARDHGLAWIDLGVFAPNQRAHALYRKLGFVEVGRIEDRFRLVEDDRTEAITDILMALAL